MLRQKLPHVTSPLPPRQTSRTPEQNSKDILASQQEYRKGVSSWNFDVAALKAAAAAQGDEDRLPPITEGVCAGDGWRRCSGTIYIAEQGCSVALTSVCPVCRYACCSYFVPGRRPDALLWHRTVGRRRQIWIYVYGVVCSVPCLMILIHHHCTALIAEPSIHVLRCAVQPLRLRS